MKLDGFGSFKIGLRTKGAEKEEDFTVSRNVTGLRVNFLSSGKKDTASGKVSRTFLGGATLKKYDPTAVTSTAGTSTSTTTNA